MVIYSKIKRITRDGDLVFKTVIARVAQGTIVERRATKMNVNNILFPLCRVILVAFRYTIHS